MSNMTAIEKALSKKLRFSTAGGSTIGVEQLFQLPLEADKGRVSSPSLSEIASELQKELPDSGTTDIMGTLGLADQTQAQSDATLKLEVLKRVIEIKKSVVDAATKAAADDSRRSILTAELERRQQANLLALSDADLQKELDKLAP